METPIKILLIDDDPQDLLLIEQALLSCGMPVEVRTAVGGEKGLVEALEYKPMVVVTDTNMAGIDGFETCRRLKEQGPAILKVIVCTGIIDAVDAGKARSAGADGYCVKSSDSLPLIAEIKGIFEEMG